MKILYVVHNFPPQPSYGCELYAYNIAQALKRHHEVHVFYRVNRPDREEYQVQQAEYEGLKVCTINNTFKNVQTFRDTYRNDAIADEFGRYLDGVKPDIVHFQHVTCLSTTCIREAARRGLPVIFTLHDFWLLCPRGQLLRRDLSLCDGPVARLCVFCNAYQLGVPPHIAHARYARIPAEFAGNGLRRLVGNLRRRLVRNSFRGETEARKLVDERLAHVREMCRHVDLFISPSEFLCNTMKKMGLPGEVRASDNGNDVLRFADFRRTESEKVRFGFVGSIIPSKGVHVLIDAFKRVSSEDAELRIHGAGYSFEGYEDYEKEMRSMARGDGRITFAGPFDNTRVGEVFAEFDVLVVPSIWYENSPLTIHEAALAGAPVIASDIGGMAEFVRDGVNGATFRTGSTRHLAAKMAMFVKDRGLLVRLRPDAGMVKTVEENAEELDGYYRQAIERHAAG